MDVHDFTCYWNFPRFSPICIARWIAREISKRCKKCAYPSRSGFSMVLFSDYTILTSISLFLLFFLVIIDPNAIWSCFMLKTNENKYFTLDFFINLNCPFKDFVRFMTLKTFLLENSTKSQHFQESFENTGILSNKQIQDLLHKECKWKTLTLKCVRVCLAILAG